MGMCTVVCKQEKFAWEMCIELFRIHENGQFPNSCKEDDF